MRKKEKNYAFIDSQNLNLGIQSMGWNLDWKKFRVYLKEKYHIEQAFMFMGHLPEHKKLYKFLTSSGYNLIFKEILDKKSKNIKGNVDAELVLQAMIEWNNYKQAVVVSGDGDFSCLVKHLVIKKKLKQVIVPNEKKSSVLLQKASQGRTDSLHKMKKKLHFEKNPLKTEQ